MGLVLRRNPRGSLVERQADHLVMSGKLQVGRIYQRGTATRVDGQWLWALNGVSPGCDAARLAGTAASLEQAQSALRENWDKWLAWAGLQETTNPVPTRPNDNALGASSPCYFFLASAYG
jgi:hypothetical protein